MKRTDQCISHLAPYQFKNGHEQGGRSQESTDFYTLARMRCPEALAKIMELMHCGDRNIELKAAMHVLDRGLGKVKEHVEITERKDISPEEKERMIRTLIDRMGYKLLRKDILETCQ